MGQKNVLGYRLRKILLGLFLVLVAGSCTVIQPERPEVQLLDLELTGLTLSHATFMVGLQVFNPNASKIEIKKIDYTLWLNDVRVASGSSGRNTIIEAEGQGRIDLRMVSSYFDIVRFLNRVQPENSLKYRLQGVVKVGGFGILGRSFTFDRIGEISAEGLSPSRHDNHPPKEKQRV